MALDRKFGSRSAVGAPGREAGGPILYTQPLQPTQTRAPTVERLQKMSLDSKFVGSLALRRGLRHKT
jgi:hypothetical protein